MKSSFLSRFFKRNQEKPIPRIAAGTHYNLQEIYDRMNARYFDGKMKVSITWFGDETREASSRRLLGSYNLKNKVIKIHRLLDHPDFPPYFISYVVYHEMLHNVFPPTQKKSGRRKIHHADFKAHEKKFDEYELAKQWEKENFKIFFKKRERGYGRT